jgi:hypothetical protein
VKKVFVIVVIEESTIDLGHICILDYYKDNPKEAICIMSEFVTSPSPTPIPPPNATVTPTPTSIANQLPSPTPTP